MDHPLGAAGASSDPTELRIAAVAAVLADHPRWPGALRLRCHPELLAEWEELAIAHVRADECRRLRHRAVPA